MIILYNSATNFFGSVTEILGYVVYKLEGGKRGG
jgi:hypothetical protein